MEIFKQRNLIDGFSEEHLEIFRKRSVRKKLERGTIVFQQGDPGRDIYWIESGWVKTFYTSLSGTVITVGLWSRGDVIGAPDLDFDKRLLSAEVVRDAIVLRLTAEDIEYCLEHIPRFDYNLAAALSFKVRWATSIFDRMATESVLARVAQTLVSLGHLHGVKTADGSIEIHQITHQDIADMVGASRPSVSLMLKKLESSGFIKTAMKKLVILDSRALIERQYE